MSTIYFKTGSFSVFLYNDFMKKIIQQLAKKYKIDLIVLFGSVAKGRAGKNSDVDVAVLVSSSMNLKKELEFRHELEVFFGREVDLVFLSNAGPLLLGQIARKGKLLYGDKKEFNTFRVYAMKCYLDFEPYFKLQEQINKNRLAHA